MLPPDTGHKLVNHAVLFLHPDILNNQSNPYL